MDDQLFSDARTGKGIRIHDVDAFERFASRAHHHQLVVRNVEVYEKKADLEQPRVEYTIYPQSTNDRMLTIVGNERAISDLVRALRSEKAEFVIQAWVEESI
jgi:hypothetical protein